MWRRYRFMRFPGGLSKAVTLSYDDGCPEDLRLADTISPYGMKCTFNLNSKASHITKKQICEHLLQKGHEIAVHGANHRAEGVLRPIEGIRDILTCRLELEEELDIIIRGMAYPDSGILLMQNLASYESIKKYLTELDIVYSRTDGGDNNSFELPSDWHAWMPTAHHINPNLMDYIDQFVNLDNSSAARCANRRPRLFFLWGHSYEFARDNNWDLLEQICHKLGGNETIWYTTNMEIYEYVKAYHSLVYSADETRVYNPTIYDIWFDVNGVIYVIKSGETLKLMND